MLTANKVYTYKGFGLYITSQIQLPEMPLINMDYYRKDLHIEVKELRMKCSKLSEVAPYFYFKESQVIFTVPNVAIYQIENGNKIIVSPLNGVRENQVRLYLLGTCMGVLLLQRQILPLHGSAIEIDGKAYAIIGHSGAGKSTLAAAFLERGYKLISDDVIPVSINNEGIPVVAPAYPQQKLWQESLDQFGMSSQGFHPIIDRESKFAIPVHARFCSEKMPLAGVFELVKTEGVSIKMNSLLNLKRLQTLYMHTYRNFLIEPLGMLEWHFNLLAKISPKITILRLERSDSFFSVNELTSHILSTLKNKE
ncbi:HPr kinase/phosphorylase [Bacillus sp. 1P02SD]|uniref:HPr kinase/phosphorylase n=1 Tax=Bacillus sp. 1P02SD TaxID=3132264 RepID=UPI0039A12A47